ncbi:MAG: ATP-grasp domain-containing protein [Proteobacteria bacterium]|nr:ATP-grasp domain-containing protein [Pseudomonadota bacterium]
MTRLLIANRGEIAVRIARTARRLGVHTIAVYSRVDRDAAYLDACDERVSIDGREATESYLCIERILGAARASRADAVHPGYGFLAENAAFARAVVAAGLCFVGPETEAMAAMGDKSAARRRLAAAGIPVLPGYDGDAQDEPSLQAAAASIGYPLMVKAAAGGGGRGLRLVREPTQLGPALRAAAVEARKAFGDGRLLLERALLEARHVEIQLIADADGRVVHLGERDCSVQRRHQKVIEEAPSPAVDSVLRARMGEVAIRVAREVGYLGAGTVEFLLDPAGGFYFMEMNTRLQVEHAVTELVTGLDLVELQLRIARGEALPFAQHQIELRGHAIEARLCAEDPANDYLPRTGEVVDWRPDPAARCDHALRAGTRVSSYYDSMLAKVVAHGASRREAIENLSAALAGTSLLGVTSNRAFLQRVLADRAFRNGAGVTTRYLETTFANAGARAVVPEADLWILAAWLSVATAAGRPPEPEAWHGWTPAVPLALPFRLEWQGSEGIDAPGAVRHGIVRLGRGIARIEAGDLSVELVGRLVAERTDGEATVNGRTIGYRHAWLGPTLWLHTADGDFAFDSLRHSPAGGAGGAAATDARAAINGRVVEVTAAVGEWMRGGDRLLAIEAMKMEHEVRARGPGRIAAVVVAVGDQVAPGQVLVRFERGGD